MTSERGLPPREAVAGRLAERVPILEETLSVGEACSLLRRDPHEPFDAVIVIAPDGRYAGAVALPQLLMAASHERLSSIARVDWPAVDALTDQERAVEIARLGGVAALPVLGEDGRPMGLVPARTLIEVLAEEHREDMQRLVGVMKDEDGARHALEDPPLVRARRRLPWLLVGLALSSAATALMAGFEEALQANIVIAFFIPALVYLADAVGTQTEAAAVRALSLHPRPLGRLLAGEVATGVLIGLPLGLLALAGVWFAFQDLRVAAGVAVSLVAASTFASALGLSLPWLLSRLGTDPAFGSGPVATILQDVLTMGIYFGVMAFLLQA